MKQAFTLIELLVVLAILDILYSVAVPTYDRYILKNRFAEAKVTLQALMLAQEKYKIEHGSYYFLESDSIENENALARELKVDLSSSNNFVYQLKAKAGTEDSPQYQIKAILRPSDTVCEEDDFNIDTKCKQTGSNNMENWVSNYSRNYSSHFLEFRHPNPPSSYENGFDYSNIYKEVSE